MRFIAVIPARSDSQSIKNKNIFPINKKPLIHYTFKELKKTIIKEKYLLSDDNRKRKLSGGRKRNGSKSWNGERSNSRKSASTKRDIGKSAIRRSSESRGSSFKERFNAATKRKRKP